jgi:diguanylate cyclase (GGDEF)-like protein
MSQRSSDEPPSQATQASPEQKPDALPTSSVRSEAELPAEREQALRQVSRLEALHALSLEVVAQHEPDQVIDRALELAVRMLNAEASGYWQVLKQGYLLRAIHGASDVPLGTRLPAGSGLTGRVVNSAQSLLVDDYRHFEGRVPQFSDVWRSLMLAPVKRGDAILGVLVISNNARPGAFNGADLAILERLATVCAISLENSRLLEAATRAEHESNLRAAQHEAVRTLSLEVMAQREPDRVIARALETVMALVQAQVGGFWRSHGFGQPIELLVTLGPTKTTPGMRMPWGTGAAGEVIATNKALLIEDYQTWAQRNPQFGTELSSVMSIPIRREQEVLGTLVVARSGHQKNFDSHDLELFEQFATPVALALDNAQLLEVSRHAELDSRRRAEITGAINMLSFELTATLEPKAMLERILERATALLGGDLGGVFLHHDNPELEVVTRFGDGWITQPRLGFGATGRAVETGQSVLVEDYPNWEHRTPAPGLRWLSAISAPLRRADTVMGAITLADTQRTGRYTSLDLFGLERFAALASIALENARLHNAERRVAKEERLRNQISSAVASLRSVREFSMALLEELAQTFGYRFLSLYTLETGTNSGTNSGMPSTTGVLHMQAQIGYKTPFKQIPLEFGINGRVARSGQAVMTSAEDPDFQIADDGMTSILCVPLRTGEQVLGTLCIESNGQPQLQNTDLKLISSLAESVSFALENARLYELERRRARDERLRFEISRAIARLSSEQSLCEALVATLFEVLGYDHISIFRYEHDGLHLQAQHGYETPMRFMPITRGITGRVARTAQAVFLPDARQDPDYLHVETDLNTMISVPLLGRDGVLGVLNVESTDSARLEIADLEMLTSLTGPVAIAIENARLFELEQRRARDERIRSSVSNALVRLRTVGELCRAVVNEVASSLAYTHVCMSQLERNDSGQLDSRQHDSGQLDSGQHGSAPSERLRLRAQVGYRNLPEFLPLQGSFSGQIARTQQATLITDTFEPSEYLRFDPELVYAVGVPLLGRDGVLGTLVVESAGTPKLTATDLEMLVSLAAPISVALENATLHESLERRARELENLGREAHFAATHDTLTGLPNRRAFEVDAMQLLAQQRGKQQPFCLAVIDLVGFKAVNDNFGHAAGDEALKMIAQTLRILSSHQAKTASLQSSSGDDVFAYRVGGDEFFLLIENDRANAFELVQQVINTVQGLEFGAGSELQVSPNIGLAEFPSDAPDLDNLLTLADTRMYAAKRAGKPVLEPDEFEHPPVPRRRKEDAEGH